MDFLSFLKLISNSSLRVLDSSISISDYISIDLSSSNAELSFDSSSSIAWESYINTYLQGSQKRVAYGGYLEQRNIYARSSHFKPTKNYERNIHIGLDLWCAKQTTVLAVLEGKIHSFKDNTNFGDYGPTIVLEHYIEGTRFYTLYGHLSRESIVGLTNGTNVNQGQVIGELGDSSVNGDYAPHLHFQIINNLDDYYGDFPGVVSQLELERFRNNCPDPNILLQLK